MNRPTMRPLRNVLILRPVELCLAVALLVTSVAFVVSPESLDHAPVGFETLGTVHHIWHYSLLVGALFMLVGLLVEHLTAYRIGFVGLVMVWATLAENTVAVLSDGSSTGVGLALRVATLAFLAIRGCTLVAPPVLHIPKQED